MNDHAPPAPATLEPLAAPGLDPLFGPASRLQQPSAWFGHIPFARWLVAATQPGVLVELGTHTGVSYAAFCDAVRAQGLPTRCYAVDTWQGDEQASFYGEQVFEEFSRYHDAAFAGFSQLLRGSFDAALARFADGCIDLLHIDGLHTYDAVRYDFESWLPKLSSRAVVLFHDTQERQGGFEVWRLWAELAQRFPSFEFTHGHGLGVLCVGPEAPGPVLALCASDPAATAALRERVGFLGQRWEAERARVSAEAGLGERQGRVAELERELAAAAGREQDGIERERQARQHSDTLSGGMAALGAELAAMRQRLAAAEAEAAAQRAVVQRLDRRRAETDARLSRGWDREAELARKREEALERAEAAERRAGELGERLDAEAERYAELVGTYRTVERRLADIEGSATWRVTKPARIAAWRLFMAAAGLRTAARALRQNPDADDTARPAALHQQEPVLLLPPAPIRLPAPVTESLALPTSEEPLVSVIVCSYGQVDVTLACLRSIATYPPRVPFELILVDDAFPDADETRRLEAVQGVQLIRNPENLGYLRSCNLAAGRARGRYLHLLNNDTVLRPGAIDALADLLEGRPEVGLAGSKLLNADGSLQEAGGILWADASAWNYGRGSDPARPEFNYVRPADYCSAASVLVRRALWERLGGFDEHFLPAYYEDTDFACRVWASGMQVLYEPRSEVVHLEGVSHGTDLGAGVKAHQVDNRVAMLRRWSATLQRDHYESGRHVLRARDRARERKVILVLDHYTPEPDRDAGSRSMMGVLDSLVALGWVVKLWPQNRIYSPIYTPVLEARGIEVIDERWPGGLDAWLGEFGDELDHAMVSRPDTVSCLAPFMLTATRAVLSYYGHDLHFARLRREAELSGDASLFERSASMERLERRVWQHFDVVMYPSEEEAAVVRSMAPHVLARGIVPFSFDAVPVRTEPPAAKSLLFVAGFAHPPNVDAAQFLVAEILPLLVAAIGPVKLVLAGSKPTEAVRALAGPDVEVTGYLREEELEALYRRHRASVVPLRFGAGVKGKVVESLSHGLPLVTTSVGAQGIEGLERVVPVHDDKAAITAALARLMMDDAAWLAQSAAQVAFAERHFSREAMRQSVLAALEAGERAAGSR
ncbi:MAG: hypothetical protein NVSMB18_08050 [Acetobacteraceae bacterium]